MLLLIVVGIIVLVIIINNVTTKIQREENIKKLDEKYMNFPKIEKEMEKIEEKITEKYDRITMDYIDVSYIEFEMYERRVEDYGFEKNSNVRYDKNNTYIILEHNEKRQTLHVVFHIKKF